MAIAHDEWRRTNLDRAMRVAFVVVLGAQIPLALLLIRLPSLRAVTAMAATTTTLGLSTFIAFHLFFSRQGHDDQ